ncbi:hypothetical protein ACI65C_010823 [Semiaphis heraclei]
MLQCLNNDKKEKMKLNIQLHRQKLLQHLESINDTVFKPKIKLVSNDLKKNNINNLVSSNIDKSNLNKLVSNDVEKNKLNKLISNDVRKNELNILVANNRKKSSNLHHNVKPKIAYSSDWKTPKRRSTIKFTNYRNKSRIQIKTYERVINTKPKNHEVLTDIDIKKCKTRSSLPVNQLQSNIQEEPLLNVEFKPEPLPRPNIEKKDPEPNIKTGDPEPPITIKKLKEQLIEELLEDNSSSSEEEIEDNISVGSNEDWNEVYQTHIDSDENDCSNSSLIEEVKNDRHKQLATNKSEDCNQFRKIKVLTKPQYQINQSKHRFRKPQDRDIHNAKERACRERIAQMFAVLRKSCSYLNSNRRVPSKHSILLAAKKECDLLKHFEKKMLAEKKVWAKANDNLRKRIAHFVSKDNKLACLI